MNSSQKSAIQKHLAQLCDGIDVDKIIYFLRVKSILDENDAQRIDNKPTNKSKALFLIDLLQKRDNGWNVLLDALNEAKQSSLAELLTKNPTNALDSNSSEIPSDQFKNFLIPLLEDYIKHEVEHIRRFWQDYLQIVKLKEIYQELEIFEIKGQKVQNQTVKGYDFIWMDPADKVFVIEGDPGIGKTTWMSKLALDWTNANEAIRQRFDLLFLVPLRYLASPTFDGLIQYLSPILQESDTTKIANCLKHPNTLLLLDGFDENPSCIEWISKLTVNNGYRSKVVITSRGSHLDEIRESKICDMRLVVKGFKDEVIFRFFELQKCENSNELFASYSQLPEMCKVPMIASILCSICKHDDVSKSIGDDENCSLFIIFDNFVEMLINMANEKRPGLTTETRNAMTAAGILALATVKIQ